MEAFITVAIPTYNRPQSVYRLSAIIADQLDSRDEILIVDDGDRRRIDPSLISSGRGSLTYSRHDHNIGMVPTWNECLRVAKNDWILMVHDDDTLSSDSLARIRKAIKMLSTPAVIAGRVAKENMPVGFRLVVAEPGAWAVLNAPPVPSGVAIHRKIVRDVGFFDELLPYSSDLEYFPRACAQYPLVYIEGSPILSYNLHGENYQYLTWTRPDFLIQLEQIESRIFGYANLDDEIASKLKRHRWQKYLRHMFGAARRLSNPALKRLTARALLESEGLSFWVRLRALLAVISGI